MISWIVLATIIILAVAYLTHGRFIVKKLGIDDSKRTPAHELNDGVDFVPAKASLLLGQHFSAISAAGPIVGPILACLWFGWLPAIAWVILGSIFIGSVHDTVSLVTSIRYKAASVGQIIKSQMSKGAQTLFLVFVWFALLYIVIAFTDITAQTFTAVSSSGVFGPAVAASSIIYLGLALLMGVLLYKFKLPLWAATTIFLPLVIGAVWVGPHLPASVLNAFGQISTRQWNVILLCYCFFASIMPMWLLLQPRGYLGGWLLYLTIAVGLFGALFGGFAIEYPAVNLEGFRSAGNGKLLFPILFITIACGACSGFHAIVSSGTTSKQLYKESDAKPVAYGSMLLEALVAVLAMATVMMFAPGSAELKTDPNLIYAGGLAKYMGLFGVSFSFAFPFALLAFSTFVYDTLDVATRLSRYIFEEIFGVRSLWGTVAATFISLVIPLLFLTLTKEKAYLLAWPIFGTSNQMLASLTLLAVSVWLIKTGKNALFTIIPMFFMLAISFTALILQIYPMIRAIVAGQHLTPDVVISGVCGLILLILGLLVLLAAGRALFYSKCLPKETVIIDLELGVGGQKK